MEYNLILNFKRSEILQTDIVFSQGDYGKAMLRLSCRDDDAPITGAQSATISFSTPNGYLVTGELVGGDGEYSYTFKGNELQAPGKITATVSLKWADGRLSSCLFAFKCRALQGGASVDSGNYLTEVDQVVQEAKAKIAELQKLIEQLKPGISSTALTKADLQNDLTQSQPGLKALDALQGTELKKMIDDLAGKTPEGLVTDATLKEALSSYILKNQIVNNLLATVPGNVLDAMQGKALGDRISKTEQSITQLNSETWLPDPLGKLYDGNAKNGDANSPTALIMSGYNISNAPGQYGLIILTLPYPVTGYYAQICISVENTTTPTRMWIRSMEKSSWKDWRTL